jgi:rubrerythrin
MPNIMYVYEKLKTMSLQDIIGYAIASEEASAKYYRHLVKDENVNELVAHRFEQMAEDEDVHKDALLCLYKKLYGDDKYKVPEGLPPFESSVHVESVQNMMEALTIAMENEHNAQKVYKFLAHHQKENKQFFKRLALMEKGHYEILKHEKEAFEEDIVENPMVAQTPVLERWRFNY